MKEYSLQEVFNEPIGSEFEVRYESGTKTDINILISGEVSKCLVWKDGEKVQVREKLITAKFTKVLQPVSFTQAITSGKLIKVDVTELNEKYRNGNKVILNNYWNNVYKSIDGILEMLSRGDNYRNEIILEGKWYIKENEVDE